MYALLATGLQTLFPCGESSAILLCHPGRTRKHADAPSSMQKTFTAQTPTCRFVSSDSQQYHPYITVVTHPSPQPVASFSDFRPLRKLYDEWITVAGDTTTTQGWLCTGTMDCDMHAWLRRLRKNCLALRLQTHVLWDRNLSGFSFLSLGENRL